MLSFFDTLDHSYQFSFVTRVISLVLVTLSSPTPKESLLPVLDLPQHSCDVLLAPVSVYDERISYLEVWESLYSALSECSI